MLSYDPNDDYSDAVCLLLPEGKATLIDVDVFKRYGHLNWQVIGTTIYYQVSYTTIRNPTPWRRNQKVRVRYRFEQLPRLVLDVPYDRLADHRYGNRWDNRRSNLRVATGS